MTWGETYFFSGSWEDLVKFNIFYLLQMHSLDWKHKQQLCRDNTQTNM